MGGYGRKRGAWQARDDYKNQYRKWSSTLCSTKSPTLFYCVLDQFNAVA